MNDTELARKRPQTSVAATLDTVGWGVFLIWIGLALLAEVGWPIFFLGTGLIMLGGQAARSVLGLKRDGFAFVLGLCFVVAGALRALDVQLSQVVTPAWLVPSVFIAMGAGIVLLAWRRREPRR